MKQRIFTSMLLVPLVFFTTCKKHNSSGGGGSENIEEDYFDCKINGVQWAGPLSDLHLNYYCACDSVLNISAYREGTGYDQEMHFISDQAVVGDTGNVIAGSVGGLLFIDYDSADPCAGSHYFTYRNGKVFLEENNTEKHYLKGTFWINGNNSNCPTDSVMEFTEGRFLVHY